MRKKHFTKLIGVLLSEKTFEQLVQVTDEQQITISKYVRKLLEENLNQTGGNTHEQ
jgi:hypothetical protein